MGKAKTPSFILELPLRVGKENERVIPASCGAEKFRVGVRRGKNRSHRRKWWQPPR